MKKSIALVLCVIMALMFVPTVSAAVDYPLYYYGIACNANDYVVTASALNYRDSASVDGKILGSFAQGAVLPVTGFNGDGKWASVTLGEKIVWVYTQYIELAYSPILYWNAKVYTVTAYPYAVVVSFANDDVETFGKIYKGDTVVVHQINDTWGLVNYEGTYGYIQMANLK